LVRPVERAWRCFGSAQARTACAPDEASLACAHHDAQRSHAACQRPGRAHQAGAVGRCTAPACAARPRCPLARATAPTSGCARREGSGRVREPCA
jgi:hypothetical protein